MTRRLVDIASYQAGMDLAAVKAAGFDLVNIKVSQGNWYTHQAAPGWADKARALDMGISTFHWLDNTATGREQADYAFARIKALGGPDGQAHQVDCEDRAKPATEQIFRDYVNRMQDLFGRHIANYTGDWWWLAASRGWQCADLTPYLWGAPDAGYLLAYPGDTSSQWHAGYGGWADYSLLQYTVAPVGAAGGGRLSQTAIRDPQVWAALTGTSSSGGQGGGGGVPVPTPAPGRLVEDGELGPRTIARWQHIMGTPADGVISDPSTLVLAVQHHLNAHGAHLRPDGRGIRQDGHTYQTVAALQHYLGTPVDGILSTPKSQAVEAVQRRLNTGRF